METMKNTARESNKEGRIVNLSSVLHKSGYKEGILFDKINDESRYICQNLDVYARPMLFVILCSMYMITTERLLKTRGKIIYDQKLFFFFIFSTCKLIRQ